MGRKREGMEMWITKIGTNLFVFFFSSSLSFSFSFHLSFSCFNTSKW